jgi:hypothetical protein
MQYNELRDCVDGDFFIHTVRYQYLHKNFTDESGTLNPDPVPSN